MQDSGFYQRSISSCIRKAASTFPCLLLTGARQVGKTTLLKSLMPEGMKYASLDDYELAERARLDPQGFLEEMGEPLCIDEIQYAPQLFRAIKTRVDANRRNGMYWMTGSQRFRLMKNVSESLAGRICILELHSLSQREMCGCPADVPVFGAASWRDLAESGPSCNINSLYGRIWKGGYPELHREYAPERNLFFSSYLQTYIERDVLELSQVGNKSAFVKLMRSAASRTGQQMVYADLARDADVSPATAKQWLSILETSGIVTLLEPYYVNSGKRLAKSPKLYFMDTGLCSWLAGWPSAQSMQESPFAGPILETWVFSQLWRNFQDNGTNPWLNYYRNARGAELDFIIASNGCLYPMEVKRSSTPRLQDLKAASSVPCGSFKMQPGLVFCTAEHGVSMPFGAFGFPISAL